MRLAAALASAVLYGLCFPPAGLALLAWVALVPLAAALRGAGAAQAARLGFAWGFVATAWVTVWLVPTLTGHFGLSLPSAVAFWLALAAVAAAPYLALAFAGFALARRRAPAALAPVLFAAAWVAAEYARAQLGLRSPWAALGDTQAGSESVRQLAALGGSFAVGALVALANATCAEAVPLARAGAARPAVAAGAILLVAGAGAWAHGAWRVAAAQVGAPGPTIALVQGNVAPELQWRSQAAGRVLRRHLALTAEALDADPAPELVVWPESALQAPLDDGLESHALRRAAVRAPILLGAPRREPEAGGRPRSFNSAILVRPTGGLEHYDKRRLLPFSETRPLGALGALVTSGDLDPGPFQAGRTPGLFSVGAMRLGVLICMEALYPELAREAAGAGARLLVVLSNDAWYRGHGAAEQHFAAVVFRAIETGVPVARAATSGVTAVVAPDGRVVARLPEGEARVLLGPTPPALPAPPLYLRAGDVFAHACLGAWALAALAGLRAHGVSACGSSRTGPSCAGGSTSA